jgi:hypothetical protein
MIETILLVVLKLISSSHQSSDTFKLHIELHKLVSRSNSGSSTYKLHIWLPKLVPNSHLGCSTCKLNVHGSLKLYYCTIMVHPPLRHRHHLRHTAYAHLTRVALHYSRRPTTPCLPMLHRRCSAPPTLPR